MFGKPPKTHLSFKRESEELALLNLPKKVSNKLLYEVLRHPVELNAMSCCNSYLQPNLLPSFYIGLVLGILTNLVSTDVVSISLVGGPLLNCRYLMIS